MNKNAWICFTMASLLLPACDDTPIDERLRASLPEIKDATFDDREDRKLKKAIEMVEDGADPNVVYYDREWGYTYTLLGFAISYGSLRQVAELLDTGADPNIPADATDLHAPPLCHVYTLLTYEPDNAVDFVRLMLDRGADVNGCPALGIVASFGRKDLVGLLLEKGASVERFVSEREYYFHRAGDYVASPLQAAAYGGDVEILETILQSGAKVEQPDNLILAAFKSFDPRMMEKCLELAPPENLGDVYTGILLSYPSADDDYYWPRQLEMLRTMQRSGYGLTPEIFDAIRRKYPKHEIDSAILSALQI